MNWNISWKPILRWTIVILVVIILVSFAALKVFVSPESVAMVVIPRIKQLFERDVTFTEVDLSYFPHLGVRLQGVEIKNSEGFSGGPLAKINHIDANIDFFSLLSGDPQIDQLVVSGWEMLLQVDSLGNRNFVNPAIDTLPPSDSLILPTCV